MFAAVCFFHFSPLYFRRHSSKLALAMLQKVSSLTDKWKSNLASLVTLVTRIYQVLSGENGTVFPYVEPLLAAYWPCCQDFR